MRHQPVKALHHFFATPPMPCPYFPERTERRLVTELSGRDAGQLHDVLSSSGFRRSHGMAYAPTCPSCQACIPIRVIAGQFRPGRTQRRVERDNTGLFWKECHAVATEEQYALFSRYQSGRHGAGEMSKMDYGDYRALIEDTPVETRVIEFRSTGNALTGVCLLDYVRDGLSAVYSFFDPGQPKKSLGTYMVLWLIRRAQSLGLPHVYLGFWIEDSPKMAYKSNFRPCEIYTDGAWSSM